MAILRNIREIPVPDFATVDKKSREVSVYYKSQEGSRRRYVIGQYLDNGNMNVNDNFRTLHPDLWEQFYGEDKSLRSSLHVGLYAATLALSSDTGLYRSIQESFGYEKGNAFIDYATCCIESKSNTAYLLPDYLKSHVSFSTKPKSDSWYSEAFSSTTEEEIHTFKALWVQSLKKAFNIESVWLAIDGTNVDCKATKADLPAQGKSKSGNSCNIVSQIMAVASGISVPVTWFVNKGNMPDSNAFHAIIEFLGSFDIKVQGVILDRGFNSQAIIDLAESLGFDWVMMLKSDCEAHSQMMKEHAEQIRYQSEYYTRVGDLFGIVDHVPVFQNSKKSSCVALYYSPVNGAERAVRLVQNTYAEMDKLNERIEKGTDEIEIQKRFKRLLKLETIDGKSAVRIDYSELDTNISAKGFFSIGSSKTLSATEIQHIYQLRDCVEKTFSAEKTGLGFNTLRVHSDASIHARMACGFIACVIRSLIEYVARQESIPTNLLIQGFSDIKLMCIGVKKIYTLENSAKRKYLNILDNMGVSTKSLMGIAAEVNHVRETGVLSQQRSIPHLDTKKNKYGLRCTNEPKAEENEAPKVSTDESNEPVIKRKPGRPKGSKNKSTLAREAAEALLPPKPPAKRGRPKGSKNKSTLEREARMQQQQQETVKRGRGRPKGSKNKSTLAREAAEAAAKRGRGRPKGSKNKSTLAREAAEAAAAKKPVGRPIGSTTKPKPNVDYEAPYWERERVLHDGTDNMPTKQEPEEVEQKKLDGEEKGKTANKLKPKVESSVKPMGKAPDLNAKDTCHHRDDIKDKSSAGQSASESDADTQERRPKARRVQLFIEEKRKDDDPMIPTCLHYLYS